MIASGASAPRSLAERFADTANVKDFSCLDSDNQVRAVAGDGSHDDTCGIDAALNSGAKIVFIPAGTYKITRPLALTNGQGILVRGAGKTSTTLKWAFAANAIKYAFLVDANVTLEDFAIVNGDPPNQRASSVALCSNAGKDNGMHDSQFHRLLISGFEYGIGSTAGLELGMMFNDLFESIDFQQCGIPVHIGAGSNNIRFSKCNFGAPGKELGTTGSRVIMLKNASTITFDNCAFEAFASNVTTGARTAEVTLSPNVSFRNCYFEPSYGLYFNASPGFVVDNSLIESFDFTVGSLAANAHVRATGANQENFKTPLHGLVRGTVTRLAIPPSSYVAYDDDASTVTQVEGYTSQDGTLSAKPVTQLMPSWTPSLVGEGGASAHTYTQQYGYYLREGNRVTAFFRVSLAAVDRSMSGRVSISGLPFRIANLPLYGPAATLSEHRVALGPGYTQLTGEGVPGGTSLLLVQNGSRADPAALTAPGMLPATSVTGQITYITDEP